MSDLVRLIGVTQPRIGNDIIRSMMNPSDLIAYCARVSNPANQDNAATSEKLLKYCITNKHWSPFEMINVVLEINTTRDIARQILRHRSFSFQEFCLSGDTYIHFAIPQKLKKGYYKPTTKIKLKDLWEKWENGAEPIPSRWNNNNSIRMPMKDRISKMYIKCYDETTGKLTTSHIKEVFKTGIKDVFEITLEDGKKIKTTKEHKFLTQNGFESLEEITGLQMHNNRAIMTNRNCIVATNGIQEYQDKLWLEKMKKDSIFGGGGIKWIADQSGYNYNTIRKWLRRFNLQYSKKEINVISPVWNKGFFGYKNKPHSIETRRKMQISAKGRGKTHNWYRGGNSKFREPLDVIDVSEFRKNNNNCSKCDAKNKKLDIHHIVPVSVDHTKQHDMENWQILCRECHIHHHRKNDYTGWQNMGAKAKINKSYVVRWQKIKSIEYVGKEETYDLEIDHSSHNYIANGMVVHNSQRYADPSQLGFEVREARLQDKKNRQNSIDTTDDQLKNAWEQKQQQLLHEIKLGYKWAIENGIAKEQARAILPEGLTKSRLYMNGNLRSWITYVAIREGNGTQKEHISIALECKKILLNEFSFLEESLGGINDSWINVVDKENDMHLIK